MSFLFHKKCSIFAKTGMKKNCFGNISPYDFRLMSESNDG